MSDDYPAIFDRITRDPRYLRNLDWGKPRRGHPEGTIRAHIHELEQNLDRLRPRLSDDEYWKLRILIHVHDTFKPDAVEGAPITDPRSHASLARAFLAELIDDAELLNIVQYHDEPYAIYLQFKKRGLMNSERLQALITTIRDWDLFLAFLLIDGCTKGKSRESLVFIFSAIEGKVRARFSAADVCL